MSNVRVYLDYHSTTPLDDRVLNAMLPYLKGQFGNPASRFHSLGWKAREAVDEARHTIASAINALPEEIIFTSGSTESNNICLRGLAEAYRSKGNHIVTCTTEHPSVLSVCAYLETIGYNITYLPVDREGMIDLSELTAAIRKETVLISLMAANNEIGVLHPLEEIGSIAKHHSILFHTDATQAIGMTPIDVQKLGIHLLSISAHKIYGPKGIGALYVRQNSPRVKIRPLTYGGLQEGGVRPGTLNVPGIVGLAKAVSLAIDLMNDEIPRLLSLRDELWSGLQRKNDMVILNGPMKHRLPNNLNVSFTGIEAQAILMIVDDIALSLGTACSANNIEPSHVLKALHKNKRELYSAVRFGLGRFTTDEDIYYTAERISQAVAVLHARDSSFSPTSK